MHIISLFDNYSPSLSSIHSFTIGWTDVGCLIRRGKEKEGDSPSEHDMPTYPPGPSWPPSPSPPPRMYIWFLVSLYLVDVISSEKPGHWTTLIVLGTFPGQEWRIIESQ
ncbi:hypothetical protein FALCPG4_000433 [Fusarium falciforme]